MKGQPLFYLFGLVVAVYALSYSGSYTVDDEHLFVSGALTFAQTTQLSAPQVYGNTRLQGSYHDVEPGQAVLASLLVPWADALQLGRVQSLFFFNLIVTAATGCLIYLTVRVLNYSERVAVVTALLYAFTTTAWPYAQTYYRDPLAAFFFMLAYLGFEWSCNRSRLVGLGLVLIGLIGGLLSKSTTAVGLIVFPLAALVRTPRQLFTWPNLKWPVVAVTLSGAALSLVSLTVSPTGPLNRLSWSYLVALLDYFLHASHTHFISAMLGPLVSPGKSLFLFSPTLLLAVASLFVARQSPKPPTGLVVWLTLFTLILAQALFYDENWFGHVNYGLRFLLPVIPLLAVACAPIVSRALDGSSAFWRWVVVVLSGWGVVVQLGGLLLNARTYFNTLYDLDPNVIPFLAAWNPVTSAILGHWQMLFNGAEWNLAWWRNLSLNPLGVLLVVGGWLLVAGLCVWGLWRGQNDSSSRLKLLLLSALLIGLPTLTLAAYRSDPLYYANRFTYQQTFDHLATVVQPTDLFLIQSYGTPLWHSALNFARLPVAWYSLPIQFPAAAQPPTLAALANLIDQLPPTTCRLWLVNDLSEFPGDLEQERNWLAAHWPLESETQFAGAGQTVKVSVFVVRACGDGKTDAVSKTASVYGGS